MKSATGATSVSNRARRGSIAMVVSMAIMGLAMSASISALSAGPGGPAGGSGGAGVSAAGVPGGGGSAAGADLSITLTDAPDPVTTGSELTYTVTVTNSGPRPASGVTVTDELPASVEFVSASSSQGDCTGSTTVTCSIGDLARDANATVTIVVRPTEAGAISNAAFVSATQSDEDSADNSATTSTTVTEPPSPTPAPSPTPSSSVTATYIQMDDDGHTDDLEITFTGPWPSDIRVRVEREVSVTCLSAGVRLSRGESPPTSATSKTGTVRIRTDLGSDICPDGDRDAAGAFLVKDYSLTYVDVTVWDNETGQLIATIGTVESTYSSSSILTAGFNTELVGFSCTIERPDAGDCRSH